MKLIWKRDYNINGRLYIEGLYLDQAGFNAGKSIAYNLNDKNKSAVIKTTRISNNKVTHNISRSKKIVPTIGIRNKSVETFIKSINKVRLYVFNGVIVLIGKDTESKNIALCEALLIHNRNIKKCVKDMLMNLVLLGILDDSVLLEDIEINTHKEYSNAKKRESALPRKIVAKLKKQLCYLTSKKTVGNGFVSKDSNCFILGDIFKEESSSKEANEDSLSDFLINNLEVLFRGEVTVNSVIVFKNRLYKKSYASSKEVEILHKLDLIEILNAYRNRVIYENILETQQRAQAIKFLKARKQINKHSPPLIPSTT